MASRPLYLLTFAVFLCQCIFAFDGNTIPTLNARIRSSPPQYLKPYDPPVANQKCGDNKPGSKYSCSAGFFCRLTGCGKRSSASEGPDCFGDCVPNGSPGTMCPSWHKGSPKSAYC